MKIKTLLSSLIVIFALAAGQCSFGMELTPAQKSIALHIEPNAKINVQFLDKTHESTLASITVCKDNQRSLAGVINFKSMRFLRKEDVTDTELWKFYEEKSNEFPENPLPDKIGPYVLHYTNENKTAEIWHEKDCKKPVYSVTHKTPITLLTFNKSITKVASASDDGDVNICLLKQPDVLKQPIVIQCGEKTHYLENTEENWKLLRMSQYIKDSIEGFDTDNIDGPIIFPPSLLQTDYWKQSNDVSEILKLMKFGFEFNSDVCPYRGMEKIDKIIDFHCHKLDADSKKIFKWQEGQIVGELKKLDLQTLIRQVGVVNELDIRYTQEDRSLTDLYCFIIAEKYDPMTDLPYIKMLPFELENMVAKYRIRLVIRSSKENVWAILKSNLTIDQADLLVEIDSKIRLGWTAYVITAESEEFKIFKSFKLAVQEDLCQLYSIKIPHPCNGPSNWPDEKPFFSETLRYSLLMGSFVIAAAASFCYYKYFKYVLSI